MERVCQGLRLTTNYKFKVKTKVVSRKPRFLYNNAYLIHLLLYEMQWQDESAETKICSCSRSNSTILILHTIKFYDKL